MKVIECAGDVCCNNCLWGSRYTTKDRSILMTCCYLRDDSHKSTLTSQYHFCREGRWVVLDEEGRFRLMGRVDAIYAIIQTMYKISLSQHSVLVDKANNALGEVVNEALKEAAILEERRSVELNPDFIDMKCEVEYGPSASDI